MSHYEIYAVKFSGPFSSSGAFVMWMKDWEAVVERNYYFWCLKSSDHAVLVDAGVSPPLVWMANGAGPGQAANSSGRRAAMPAARIPKRGSTARLVTIVSAPA